MCVRRDESRGPSRPRPSLPEQEKKEQASLLSLPSCPSFPPPRQPALAPPPPRNPTQDTTPTSSALSTPGGRAGSSCPRLPPSWRSRHRSLAWCGVHQIFVPSSEALQLNFIREAQRSPSSPIGVALPPRHGRDLGQDTEGILRSKHLQLSSFAISGCKVQALGNTSKSSLSLNRTLLRKQSRT